MLALFAATAGLVLYSERVQMTLRGGISAPATQEEEGLRSGNGGFVVPAPYAADATNATSARRGDDTLASQGQPKEQQKEGRDASDPPQRAADAAGPPLWARGLDEAAVRRKLRAQKSRHALPPLASILGSKGEIVGDPQPLLQYGIVGFGKCGTTTMHHLLRRHDELQSLPAEMWRLHQNKLSRFLWKLHADLPLNLSRGYKCPSDIFMRPSLEAFRDKLPKTKLLIGVRHPVVRPPSHVVRSSERGDRACPVPCVPPHLTSSTYAHPPGSCGSKACTTSASRTRRASTPSRRPWTCSSRAATASAAACGGGTLRTS
jgi:hypothetical protein